MQHLRYVGEDDVQIENLGPQHLLPAEGQKLRR